MGLHQEHLSARLNWRLSGAFPRADPPHSHSFPFLCLRSSPSAAFMASMTRFCCSNTTRPPTTSCNLSKVPVTSRREIWWRWCSLVSEPPLSACVAPLCNTPDHFEPLTPADCILAPTVTSLALYDAFQLQPPSRISRFGLTRSTCTRTEHRPSATTAGRCCLGS